MEEKKVSAKKNYVYNVIYQLFLIIVPLIVTPYISRVLSPEGIGQYSFSYSLITYFTILGALGFGYYAQREIAKFQNNMIAQSRIFWEIIICRSLSVVLSLLLNLILCFTNVYGDYTTLMFIFSINIIGTGFDIAFLFQGNEKFGKIVLLNGVIKVFSVVCIFLFVKNTNDVWIYTLINALMLIISNLILWLYLPKYLVRIKISELKPLRHLKGTLRLFIPTIATLIYTVLDKTLIGLLIDETYVEVINGVEVVKKYSDLENGYYEQSEKMVKMVMTIITSIGTVMIPRNSSEYKKGNINQVKENIYKSSRFVWMIGIPLTLGIIATASNFVPWFYGEGYDKCVSLISLLSPLILIIGFSNIFAVQYLVPIGKDLLFCVSVTIGALVNLIMNLILIPQLWSIGAAIGTIVAESVVTIGLIIVLRKDLNIKKILFSSFKYVLSGLVMFGAVYITSLYLDSGILNSFLLIFEGGTIYFLMLLLLRDEVLYFYLTLILKKIKRKE